MLAELAGIVQVEVDLIVVGTAHVSRNVAVGVTVGDRCAVVGEQEVAFGQQRVIGVLLTGDRSIEVRA